MVMVIYVKSLVIVVVVLVIMELTLVSELGAVTVKTAKFI